MQTKSYENYYISTLLGTGALILNISWVWELFQDHLNEIKALGQFIVQYLF